MNSEGKKRLPEHPTLEEYFEQLYWKDAGFDRKSHKKTLTLIQFEERYLEELMILAKKNKGKTIEDKVLQIQDPSEHLKQKLKEFDHLYNVKWPMVHLKTAQHYLNSKGENKAATGGSEWKKYLHPKYQQRKFFPLLWSEEEKKNWGTE